MKKWLNFKTFFRMGILGYWLFSLFVIPAALFLIVPYVIIRFALYIDDSRWYDEWKYIHYGKHDRALTIRKLFYILKTSESLSLKKANVEKDYEGNFYFGKVSIDEYLEITLRSKELRYEAILSFKKKPVAAFTGFSFQKIKWELEDLPEAKKAVEKFHNTIEQEFACIEKEKKKEKEKTKTKERKVIAKEIRETYKKESSI